MVLRGSVVDQHHALRQLELGQPAFERCQYAALVERRARLRDDDGRTPSPKSLCGTPITALSMHARDGVDLGLDLLRIDVVAAGDDEILAAADDVDVAVASSILPRSPVMKNPSARNSALVFSGMRQ